MASAEVRTFERDDIRLTVRASTIDVVLYVNWIAETIRERKVRRQFRFATWDEWQREGDPIPIGAFYQLAPGTIPPPGMGNPMGPFTSSPTGSPGYRNVGLYQVALSKSFTEGENPSVGSASGLVRSVDGMTVSFEPPPFSWTPGLSVLE